MSQPGASRIRNVRLHGKGGEFDIHVADGVVSRLEPASDQPILAGDLDGRDNLAVAAFVDGHVHLDKTLLGAEWVPHTGDDTVGTRISVEKQIRAQHADTMHSRAELLARRMLAYGTTALRTHVDIDEVCGLSGLHTLLALREQLADVMDIQIVAFPQSGLRNSATVIEDLKSALREGADVLGGLDPATIDGDIEWSLDQTFDMAVQAGVGIDIHLHDRGEVGARTVEALCQRTEASGLKGRVVVSHGFCLADADASRLAQLAERMAIAGVSLMTAVPGPGTLVPVAELHRMGVRVFTGSDNIRDAWAPFGNGDMLDRARQLAYRADLRTDEGLELALDCATRFPAEFLGFAQRGPKVGAQADLVLLPSPSIQQAVCDAPATRRVIRKGREVAHL